MNYKLQGRRISFVIYLLSFIIPLLFLTTCTKDKFGDQTGQAGYPKEIAAIMVNKCSASGCHNTQSSANAGGLDFSTWDNMFKGGKNGSSIIPYSIDYSYALYFINPDSSLGLKQPPQMPFNQAPLSQNEYFTIRNWIAKGAPDKNGFVKFSDDPNRKKFYVCMQGCDQVAVFDAATRVIMRYVEVGVDAVVKEQPHDIGITPDGKYWAMAFINGQIVQFFNTTDDKLVATVTIGPGFWNIITFTPDSKKAYISSTDPNNSKIAEVNISPFSLSTIITGVDAPHGMEVNQAGTILYVTSQYGNHINKIHLNDYSIDQVTVDGSFSPNSNSLTFDPHQIAFSPDQSEYFVSCQASNEVRIFKTSNDSLLAILPVGGKPQEMEDSDKKPYMFVTCTDDSSIAGQKGSVYIINYLTNTIVSNLYTGYQPHGIDVDDDHNVAYVANLNYGGPAPHHVTGCGGKDGYITIIDMNSLQLLNNYLPDGSSYLYKNEVLPFPYEVAYRK